MFELIEETDVVGYGRLVYNGRYFGLPMEVIEEIKRLQVADRRNNSSIGNTQLFPIDITSDVAPDDPIAQVMAKALSIAVNDLDNYKEVQRRWNECVCKDADGNPLMQCNECPR